MSHQNVSPKCLIKCLIKMSQQNVSCKCLNKMSHQNLSAKCLIKITPHNVFSYCLLKSLIKMIHQKVSSKCLIKGKYLPATTTPPSRSGDPPSLGFSNGLDWRALVEDKSPQLNGIFFSIFFFFNCQI